MKKETELTEGKNWTCILYPEEFGDSIEYILRRLSPESGFWSEGAEFWYILHDQDIFTEDDLEEYKATHNGAVPEWNAGDHKKPHYHVVVHNSSNCIKRNAVRKFGVPENYVRKVGNLKQMVRYLVHRDNPEKLQYTEDQVITNASGKLESFLKEELDMTDKARLLLEYIYSDNCVSLTSLANFAINNKCWDELRRGQHIYTQLLNERKVR